MVDDLVVHTVMLEPKANVFGLVKKVDNYPL